MSCRILFWYDTMVLSVPSADAISLIPQYDWFLSDTAQYMRLGSDSGRWIRQIEPCVPEGPILTFAGNET